MEGGSAGVDRCFRARSAENFLHYVHTHEAFSCHFVRRRKELQQIDTLCTLGSGRSTATGICSTQLRLIPHMWLAHVKLEDDVTNVSLVPRLPLGQVPKAWKEARVLSVNS